jgi:NAD(P)-dependent dehydrogenase (short-subunit alcohol dehydrogenase family)
VRVSKKIALVTGGGSGIGEAICQRLAEEGATVIVTDINEASARRVADAIGGGALGLHQDVTSERRWTEVVAEAVTRFGRLDVLVNNAGIAVIGTAEEASLADWQATQKVNLDAVFLGTREAIKTMKSSGGGSIINISSVEGIIGEPLVAAYNASKGGVRIFTKSAALHCAAQGYGIRVNSVHPGFIGTAMVADAVASLGETEGAAFEARIMDSIPLGRMGEPRDIANGVLYLASEESSYVTGAELVIDGGYIAR